MQLTAAIIAMALAGPPAPVTPTVPAATAVRERGSCSGDAAWIVGSAGADLLSTEWGLSRGAYEANPLGQTLGRRLALKGAMAALTTTGACYAVGKGQPKAARRVRWIIVGIHAVAVAWNVRTGLKGD